MVKQIVKELGTDKKLNMETTKGIQELLIGSQSPFQAINYIRQRSVSAKYKSSSFCFFENQAGYNFATVEFLFDQGKKKIGDKIFFYDSTLNQKFNSIDFRNIIGLHHVGRADTVAKLQQGALQNNVKYFDILTGSYQDAPFSFHGQDFTYPSDNPQGLNTSTFVQKYNQKKKFKQFIPVDSSKPDTFLPQSRGPLQSFAQQLVQNLMHIHIYGDSIITAGDVITCKLPSIKTLDTAPESDRLVAGNYLVAKLRHILVNGPRWNYTQALELVSGSYNDTP
jgi:hypothetical protein